MLVAEARSFGTVIAIMAALLVPLALVGSFTIVAGIFLIAHRYFDL
jgi:hypothetical protein